MKKSVLFFTGLFIAITIKAQSPAVNSIIDKYAGQDGYTYVYISQNMFQLAATLTAKEDPEVSNFVGTIKQMVVLTKSFDSLTGKTSEFVNEVEQAINKDDYKSLLVVKDGGDDVDILAKEVNGKIEELLLTVKSDDEDVVLILSGQIDLNKVAKLSEKIEIDGMEHLKLVAEVKN
ncbi:MAG: DUF4252 domain-containing protein [Bacteroidales bacterium]|nr:DUF4252 domain-containing protein [Bacteroidales bacterium]MBN2818286.1 DUF4252 domain-containing protein [Bacteroidales bacterium]